MGLRYSMDVYEIPTDIAFYDNMTEYMFSAQPPTRRGKLPLRVTVL